MSDPEVVPCVECESASSVIVYSPLMTEEGGKSMYMKFFQASKHWM